MSSKSSKCNCNSVKDVEPDVCIPPTISNVTGLWWAASLDGLSATLPALLPMGHYAKQPQPWVPGFAALGVPKSTRLAQAEVVSCQGRRVERGSVLGVWEYQSIARPHASSKCHTCLRPLVD